MKFIQIIWGGEALYALGASGYIYIRKYRSEPTGTYSYDEYGAMVPDYQRIWFWERLEPPQMQKATGLAPEAAKEQG